MISRPVYEDFFLFFQYKEVRGIAALAGPKNALRHVLYIGQRNIVSFCCKSELIDVFFSTLFGVLCGEPRGNKSRWPGCSAVGHPPKPMKE